MKKIKKKIQKLWEKTNSLKSKIKKVKFKKYNSEFP